MPFRDREWEDFQRDCSFFPAYTDYIFGVDERPEAADEAGLHPQIYEPPPLPPQRLLGLPPPVRYPVAFDPVRDAAIRPSSTPTQRPTSLLRQESSMDSMVPTPCPAPRVLPPAGPPMTLLRPNELVSDPQFSFIPLQDRVNANLHITQAWAIMNSDAVPMQKAKAMGYIKTLSRLAAVKRQEYQVREAAALEAETWAGQEWKVHDEIPQMQADAKLQEQMLPQQLHASPRYNYNKVPASEYHQAEATAEDPANSITSTSRHENAIPDLSQLPAYVQSLLPQLWTCTDIIYLQSPPTDPERLQCYQQAQTYLMRIMQSVPPHGRPYINVVMDGIIKLSKQGCDPLAMLKDMPRVEDVLGM